MSGINDYLRVAFFVIMGVGLALASFFLWYGRIESDQWTTICLTIFGIDRVSNAISEGIGAARKGVPKDADGQA